MADRTDLFLKVVSQLPRWGRPKEDGQDDPVQITCDTELYYDLMIYGHDLFELVSWLEREFAVPPDLNLSRYGPNEVPLFRPLQMVRRILGLQEPRYESLKVRDIIAAINAKRWPDGT
jgi:hypothetical protein